MKLGWISAACYATTGYGVQTKEILTRLIKMGYEAFNIGGIGGETVWGGKMNYPAETHEEDGKKIIDVEIPVVPTRGHLGGKDVAEFYIQSLGLDVVVSLWDCFAVDYTGELSVPAINYLPIDAPFTGTMRDMLRDSYKIVAYSKFGYQELLRWFHAAKIGWIPHGIDCEKYKPVPKKKANKIRETFVPNKVPEDAFLLLNVGANVGERKQLPLLMYALRKFFKQHDDAYLYMFTNPTMAYPRGYKLLSLAQQFGIFNRVCWPHMDPILEPWSTEEMVRLLSTADVLVAPTIGEGFGLPTLEAEACGTPAIITDCSTSRELVGGHGWLIETIPQDEYVFVPVWVPTNQIYPVPNMKSLLSCLEDAYQNRDKLEEYGKKSREFALNYDWGRIMPRWDALLKSVESDLEMLRSIAQ